jgi:transcription-repair coupling factor (superfamily II helicase)
MLDLAEIIDNLRDGKLRHSHVSGLWGSARAFVSKTIMDRWPGFVLFVAPSIPELERFQEDLLYFDEESGRSGHVDLPGLGGIDLTTKRPTAIPDSEDLREPTRIRTGRVDSLPPWEILPLETMSPYDAISHRRLVTLDALRAGRLKGVVTTVDTLMARIIPRRILEQSSFKIEIFKELYREQLHDSLHNLGYRRVDIVENVGDYAIRGGVLDIHVPLYKWPARIELLGDQVESIREFEIGSQRSLSQLLSIDVIPCKEIVYSQEAIARAASVIEEIKNSVGGRLPHLESLAERLERRYYFDGLEWHQPLLYGSLDSLFSWLPASTLVVMLEASSCWHRIKDFENLSQAQFRHFRPGHYPYVGAEAFFLGAAEIEAELVQRQMLTYSLFAEEIESGLQPLDLTPKSIPNFHGKLGAAVEFIRPFLLNGFEVTLITRNSGEQQLVQKAIDEFNEAGSTDDGDDGSDDDRRRAARRDDVFSGSLEFHTGRLTQGFVLEEMKKVFLSPNELFQEKARRSQESRFRGDELISSFRDLKKGDYVVHIDHGIGQYMGTEEISVEGIIRDFLILEYADNDKLFLPMERINLIQRFAASENAVKLTLDKLGSTRWDKVKAKVQNALREMAQELIELYASREVIDGFNFGADDHWQREFELNFKYEETHDQLKAITDVKADMEDPRPMDRLVCGDVGFGKTEVAMRAAFKAVMSHTQVAVLAPTTILAQQHWFNFKDRFDQFPVRVDVLSRFRSSKEQKSIIQDIEAGKVDIIIGTHRLLSKDIQFKNLGLIIIDEEHRFGVSHKEKLKHLRTKADVLTMTATPIPRTLHMSIAGLRDMSIISTPPENRQPIQSKVLKFNGRVIREAILREIQRGGQVFFVHNRVRSIYSMAGYLTRLLPDITFGVAHGQMKERELKAVMDRFVAREFDVLVTTTIIESGIDIPTANTMIINRADRFGLAQLYQLRGRVGRAHHRAYCYLLIPGSHLLNRVAEQRLKVIQELTDLGSGFRIAAHDLEIRGAGNLLGAEQHGHINAVGFDLYCSMLEKAVKELKGEEQRPEIETHVAIPIEAYIPKVFIPDTNQRLTVYRKLSLIKNAVELSEFSDELRDRFGTLPVAVQRLLRLKGFTLECNILGIERLEISKGNCVFHYAAHITFSPEEIVGLMKSETVELSFPSSHSVKLRFPKATVMDIFNQVQKFIKNLKPSLAVSKDMILDSKS